ncbi:MAG: class I SAM-dependent methyltransferase [Nitrospira sp.]|nr:class I SAM-dependent methyltransferase [Nitrospira sp.]MDH4244016.1 class I SAM-dependent methyltransferase [Nitrospira sp.]MDH4355888.1 class I SAM-dependent methyltransferase [Nitrospira sp.]MDH5317897.1 class I SAM-dependent methyltransferase [Nitrospira sp.]
MEKPVWTDSVQEIARHPLEHLDYFMEWGTEAWQHLMSHALENFLGTNLKGQHVLEIGSRYGRMACLFALLGGKVIGLDLNKASLSVAQREAKKWNVTERTAFVQGGKDLSILKDNSFDVVFSKSVLVLVPGLGHFLEEVNAKLKPGGKIVFLENAKGPWFVHLLRTFRHREWDYTKARYFTSEEIRVVSAIFDGVTVRKHSFPPVVLMLGHKRS